jgi:hypothetical protein
MTNPLGMAISNRNPSTGGIIHSDHGTRGRFTSWACTRRAKDPSLLPPMGSNGDCP